MCSSCFATLIYVIRFIKAWSFFYFFFSSRRRHTIWPRDWSSDVCSSDLQQPARAPRCDRVHVAGQADARQLRRSEERRVGKSVELGGRRINKKTKKNVNKSDTNRKPQRNRRTWKMMKMKHTKNVV